MASYSTSEFRPGVKVLLDGEPCVIVESEFVKPGKGQAFNRVKLKRLLSGRLLEKTFKSGETLEAADVQESELTYLYTDGSFWHFMDPSTYEQIAIEKRIIGSAAFWLVEQASCTVILWNDQPITVTPPTFVELLIAETDPGLRGDTASSGSKPARLSTGAQIKVPLFVQTGEVVKVDTRTGTYISRVR